MSANIETTPVANATSSTKTAAVSLTTAQGSASCPTASNVHTNYIGQAPGNNQSDLPSAWNLITATGILLAFLLGLYTLIARERKSPYLINSVASIFLFCMLGALADGVSTIVPDFIGRWLIYAGAAILLIAIAMTIWRVYLLVIRLTFFVDTANPKHFLLFRKLKAIRRAIIKKPDYEHHTIEFNDTEMTAIRNALNLPAFGVAGHDEKGFIHRPDEKNIRSIAVGLNHQEQANSTLAKLALIFLKSGYLVQYLTASRHPIGFIKYLKQYIKSHDTNGQWANYARQIVVIDAYTPHFGFTDSIYQQATKEIGRESVQYLESTETFAGIHTAASIAFNKIKKSDGGEVRKPALIIYEDCYALADLESVEQYRIFLRHVIPSERIWDGMFTVFAETVQAENDWNLLKSYVDAVLNLRKLDDR